MFKALNGQKIIVPTSLNKKIYAKFISNWDIFFKTIVAYSKTVQISNITFKIEKVFLCEY